MCHCSMIEGIWLTSVVRSCEDGHEGHEVIYQVLWSEVGRFILEDGTSRLEVGSSLPSTS